MVESFSAEQNLLKGNASQGCVGALTERGRRTRCEAAREEVLKAQTKTNEGWLKNLKTAPNLKVPPACL